MSAVPKAVQKQAKRVERLAARIERIKALQERGDRDDAELAEELEMREAEYAFLSKKVKLALKAYE